MSDTADDPVPPPPGNKHPRQSEVADRIAFTQDLLARGHYVCTIKAELKRRYGVKKSAAGRYIAVARAREARMVAVGRDQMRSACRGTLDWVIRTAEEARDVTAAVRVKLEAYGLNIKLPPVEAVCEAAGITPEQFYAALAQATGRTLPGTPQTPRHDPEPPAV